MRLDSTKFFPACRVIGFGCVAVIAAVAARASALDTFISGTLTTPTLVIGNAT